MENTNNNTIDNLILEGTSTTTTNVLNQQQLNAISIESTTQETTIENTTMTTTTEITKNNLMTNTILINNNISPVENINNDLINKELIATAPTFTSTITNTTALASTSESIITFSRTSKTKAQSSIASSAQYRKYFKKH
jgi:hypothetical protein